MNKKALFIAASVILSASLATTSASASSYTVQSGDTLWGIAYKHSVSISDLKQWNSLTSDVIKLNQQLNVSAPNRSVPAPAPAWSPAPAASGSYTVKAGDTLYRIASKLDVAVSDLQQWNNLQTSVIFVGQQLKVPSPSSPGPSIPAVPALPIPAPAPITPAPAPAASEHVHKVIAGDTLSKIGLKYNVSISSLKSWNSLTSDNIYIGQSLKVGSATATAPTSAPVPAAVPSIPPAVADNAGLSPITIANSLIGAPYLWSGTTPGGFDCSGFIYYVYKQAGFSMGRTSTVGYFNYSVPVTAVQPGDLVFFRDTYKIGISHMGIYLGNNEFIHAGSSGGVQLTSLDHPYWKSKFDSFRRFN